jgi:Tfp pilus assembly protein PilW
VNDFTLTLTEIFVSLVIESTILAGVFSFLANRANEKQEQQLKQELTKIEQQNKFVFELLAQEIGSTKTEIISEIKEAHTEQRSGTSIADVQRFIQLQERLMKQKGGDQ